MIGKNRLHIYQSLRGVRKNNNEDGYLVIENEHYDIYVVFDGVGSAINSKEGTILAKEFIVANYQKYFENKICVDKLMRDCNNYIISSQLPEAFTTYCIVVAPKNNSCEMVYSFMGDSRIYIISRQFIEQISVDDKSGFSNILTKCLGMDDLVDSDFQQYYMNPHDLGLLLCTDGFYYFLEQNRMKFFEIFNKKNMRSISNEITSIITGQNIDDATFVLIR